MNPKNELGAKRNPIIDALLRDNPSIPHRTAGRMLYLAHPALFSSVNNARMAVALRTGNMGARNRKGNQKTYGKMYRQPFTGEALPIPTPYWDSTPFVFDTEKCLILADVHIPFHDPAAITLAVKEAKRAGCKDVLLLGDILDHYQESDFCKVPDAATLQQELKDGGKFFRWLRSQFKGRIVYKDGNHEERWAVRVHKAMPETGRLLDSFTDVFTGVAELGFERVKDRRRVDMGLLTAIHGHELGRGLFNPVSAARTLQLRAKECTICARWHVPSQHRERTIRQKHIGTWGIGCNCHLSPQYAPVNNWAHGFALFERLDTEGRFIVRNHTVIGGMVV